MYEPNLLDNLVGDPVNVWSLGGEVVIHGTLSGMIRDKNDAITAISLSGKLMFDQGGEIIERPNAHGTVIPWHSISMIAGSASKKA